MGATALSEVISARQFYRNKASEARISSIEKPLTQEAEREARIVRDLPAEINELNVGMDWLREAKANRYRKLIREGHLNDLLELVALAPKMAQTTTPANWFAAWAGKKHWERTLKTLTKLRRVAQVAEEVATRVKALPKDMGAVLKAVWRHGERAVQMAVTASETAVTKKRPEGSAYRLFCFLAFKQADTPAGA
ncbi:hypothetical protein [Streptacidiphilus cavernicola]|uniref:Uncharacterized protein n=1 Tax=Streptacidiphilus cavernicola TaxID=3342716 RepID=A0ABV6W046_9ACTN